MRLWRSFDDQERHRRNNKWAYRMQSVFRTLAAKVSPSHTAVLVVDMQHAFCLDQGSSGPDLDRSRVRAIIPGLQQFIGEARRRGVRVIFTQMVREENDFPASMREHTTRRYGRETSWCLKGAWETGLIPELQPLPGEAVIQKPRYSSFYRTSLEDDLREAGTVSIIVTGVATNICVDSTCRDAYMRGIHVVVPRDLVASVDAALGESALLNIDRYFGEVVTSSQILDAWDNSNRSTT